MKDQRAIELSRNYEKDLDTVSLLQGLGFDKNRSFTANEFTLRIGKVDDKGRPLVQCYIRSLNRLADSGFLAKVNIKSQLGRVITTQFKIVGDFDSYLGMRKEVFTTMREAREAKARQLAEYKIRKALQRESDKV